MNKQESTFKPMSGYIGLLLTFVVGIGGIALGILLKNPIVIVLAALTFIFLATGLTAISPNGSRVLTLFGAYKGTVRETGSFG